MVDIEEKLVTGFENRTKQEVLLIKKDLERLQRLYSGVRSINKKPALLVLADPKHEKIAVREAHRLNIPVVGVVDTNCDPDDVTYPIPGNDDAIRSITLFFSFFADAVESGRAEAAKKKAEAPKAVAQKPAAKPQPKVEKAPVKEVKQVKVEAKSEEKKVAKTPVKKTTTKTAKADKK